MFGFQFSILVSPIHSLGCGVIKGKMLERYWGPASPMAIPLAEMGKLLEVSFLGVAMKYISFLTLHHTMQGEDQN